MKPKLPSVAAAALCIALAPTWSIAQAPATPAPGTPPPPPPAPAPHGEHHASPPDRPGHGPRPDDARPHRGPEDRPHLEGRRARRMEESKPQPFLGVVTQSMPEALSTQLGLPEGFGLLVEDVLPNSPAATAGVQQHDVLKQFNDQQLVSPEQLARLVTAAGKDAEVSLTVVRKGQEQKVTVRIGEESRPARLERGRGGQGFFPRWDRRSVEEGMDRLRENMREHQERLKELQERSRDEMERAMKEARRFGAEILPEDVLKESPRSGAPKVRVFSDSSSSSWDTSKARVFLKDNDGEIVVNLENGKRTMIAKDAQGKVVFDGPIDTEEQRKAIPEAFRKKLEQVKVGEGEASGSSTPPPPAPATPPTPPAPPTPAAPPAPQAPATTTPDVL